jgi:peptidoglycan/xylan/chitin deacetylase (PgdA/CDA1 family)
MVVEMSDSGLVKFESHTNTHPSLVAISASEASLTDQVKNSKLKIEEITGKPVLALAYPNGEFNDKVKEITKEYYLFGLRKDLGMHNTDYDNYEVRRIRIDRETSLIGFIKYVGG